MNCFQERGRDEQNNTDASLPVLRPVYAVGMALVVRHDNGWLRPHDARDGWRRAIITDARFDRNCSVRSAGAGAIGNVHHCDSRSKGDNDSDDSGPDTSAGYPNSFYDRHTNAHGPRHDRHGRNGNCKRQYHRNGHCRHPDRATVAHANALINTHCDAYHKFYCHRTRPRHYDCSTGEGDVDRSPDCHPAPEAYGNHSAYAAPANTAPANTAPANGLRDRRGWGTVWSLEAGGTWLPHWWGVHRMVLVDAL